jgi:hypothetical protein
MAAQANVAKMQENTFDIKAPTPQKRKKGWALTILSNLMKLKDGEFVVKLRESKLGKKVEMTFENKDCSFTFRYEIENDVIYCKELVDASVGDTSIIFSCMNNWMCSDCKSLKDFYFAFNLEPFN